MSEQQQRKPEGRPEDRHEPEFTGSGWKNPYVIYVILTVGLFAFLIIMGYVAWTNGWIPNRGVGQ